MKAFKHTLLPTLMKLQALNDACHVWSTSAGCPAGPEMQCRSSLASDVPNQCLCGAAISCEVYLFVTRPKHSS